ncbi:hypothetical protein DPMN_083069, partial [Dreissena polymorpha]
MMITALPPGDNVFQQTINIFEFNEDRIIHVHSRDILTRFNYSHIKTTAQPPGGHVLSMDLNQKQSKLGVGLYIIWQ